MSCVKVKFESYLLLLLFSYDGNWPVYFLLLALGLICDTKEVWLRHARYFKLLSRHSRCLPETLHCPKKAAVQPFFPIHCLQSRSSRPPNPQLGGGPRPTLGAQVSLKLLFGYVTIFSSADLFTTDLNCRKKLACDIISE